MNRAQLLELYHQWKDVSACNAPDASDSLFHFMEWAQKHPAFDLCPHGMPLAENICGPCSEGRPNRQATLEKPLRAATIRVDSCTASTGQPLIGFDFIDEHGRAFAHGHVELREGQAIAAHIGKLMTVRTRSRRQH